MYTYYCQIYDSHIQRYKAPRLRETSQKLTQKFFYMRYSDATLSDDMKEQNEIFMGRKMLVLVNRKI